MDEVIDVLIDEKGNIVTNFNGFQGDSCYTAGKEIVRRLKELGVAIDIQEIIPHESAPQIPEVVRVADKKLVSSRKE